MSKFRNFQDDLKSMFSTPQTPASTKPSMDPRRIWIAVLICGGFILGGIGIGYLWSLGSSGPAAALPSQVDGIQTAQTDGQEGSLVIQFKESGNGTGSKFAVVRASKGTLVRVRLLNSVETFDTVPAFAQVADYALGQAFYGWTLVGDASGDGNVNRVKVSFHMARSPNGTSGLDLTGQALSLDGTLGVRAEKVGDLPSRFVIGGGKALASGLANSVKGTGDLSSLLLRALFTGLESEVGSDLGATYNRNAALALKPGEEFFVQLTENF